MKKNAWNASACIDFISFGCVHLYITVFLQLNPSASDKLNLVVASMRCVCVKHIACFC
jgi:hypothetical protein